MAGEVNATRVLRLDVVIRPRAGVDVVFDDGYVGGVALEGRGGRQTFDPDHLLGEIRETLCNIITADDDILWRIVSIEKVEW